jgi:hypothetical protein
MKSVKHLPGMSTPNVSFKSIQLALKVFNSVVAGVTADFLLISWFPIALDCIFVI